MSRASLIRTVTLGAWAWNLGDDLVVIERLVCWMAEGNRTRKQIRLFLRGNPDISMSRIRAALVGITEWLGFLLAAVVLPSFLIPSLFFEPLAVDQSTTIGDGASFSAFRKAIISPPTWSETRNMDGLVMTLPKPKVILPKYIVYKVARVAFTDIG